MKINGNEIRVGNVLNYENKLWVVLKTQHTQPGKGGAYMQVEMKCMQDSTKKNERFRSSESVERVYFDERPYQYLYLDSDMFVFMDNATFDQVTISKEFIGDSSFYLKESMVVDILFYEEKPISIKLPETVVLEITEADPVVKGQTATSSYKPAVLENGLKILVPPHIEAGIKIVVNTSDGSYVERAKV